MRKSVNVNKNLGRGRLAFHKLTQKFNQWNTDWLRKLYQLIRTVDNFGGSSVETNLDFGVASLHSRLEDALGYAPQE